MGTPRNVMLMCLGMHGLGFTLFGFFSASWTCRFTSFVKFVKFQPLLLQSIFQSRSLHLLLGLRQWAGGSTVMVLKALSAFLFQSLFSLWLRMDKFCFLFSSVSQSLSSVLCYWAPSVRFLFVLFFSLIISIWFLLSLLWCMFSSWHGNFPRPWMWPKIKQIKNTKLQTWANAYQEG